MLRSRCVRRLPRWIYASSKRMSPSLLTPGVHLSSSRSLASRANGSNAPVKKRKPWIGRDEEDFVASYKAGLERIPRRGREGARLSQILSFLEKPRASEEKDVTSVTDPRSAAATHDARKTLLKPRLDREEGESYTFSGLGVNKSLCARLALRSPPMHPNKVQIAAIEALLYQQAPSVSIQAPTGQGKTLAYVLPILTMLHERAKTWLRERPRESLPVMGVIMLPTRELCAQVAEEVAFLIDNNPAFLSQYLDDIELYSSKRRFSYHLRTEEALHKQAKRLHEAPPVLLIGTSKRLNELFNPDNQQPKRRKNQLRAAKDRNALQTYARPSLDNVSVVCLDEADSILKPLSKHATEKDRFNRQRHPKPGKMFLDFVLAATRERKRRTTIVYVSATLNNALRGELRAVTRQHTQALTGKTAAEVVKVDAEVVNIRSAQNQLMPSKLKHFYSVLPPELKCEELSDYISAKSKVLLEVFDNAQLSETGMRCAMICVDGDHRFMDYVSAMHHHMEAKGQEKYGIAVMHEFLSRTYREREELNAGIEQGTVRFVLTTEDAARGMHLPGVDAVFVLSRFSLGNPGTYMHLAGRAAREEKVPVGYVVSIVTPREARLVGTLEATLRGTKFLPVPTQE